MSGPLDGVVAFTLVATALLIWRRAGTRTALSDFRLGPSLAAIVPALMLVALWWYRGAVDLNVLLPGVAWRTWLVLYTVPFARTCLRSTARQGSHSPAV